MTENIYYTESINKIISVFAIECSIVFGFIFLTIFCCTGKLFDSKKSNDKNKFIFEKYSSKYKISTKTLENLFKKEKNDKNDKNNSNDKHDKKSDTNTNTNTNTNKSTTNKLGWFNWFYNMMNFKKEKKSDKIVSENAKSVDIDLELG